ncbi:hypothetical protein Swit_2169 [Rhizorhabdus wittichii RW1]|uniref:Uncharacterized protein n=1 Tax=Rhizorhabdus wittichii (strain DSM 6014 / CCUG 31198 / JCM 15750 / NBRC 105917 / EY 4224 / RW1) TaxID=392499 RepID=A0A9J9HBJ9_RHIWR|nr:hypothetical protein Swit_2169 [Rhizorhabdus wittichii RW1]
MYVNRHGKAPAARATWSDVRHQKMAVDIVCGMMVRLLRERNYRVVAPSLITSGGWGPAPGRWGVDEPEPGADAPDYPAAALERAGQLTFL